MKSIPADVSAQAQKLFEQNYDAITRNRNKLLLFAGDQKIEHLNGDFYGEAISDDALNPRHLFKIASKGTIGAFATQLGLIARYGTEFKNINYIVKLNSKTNLIPTDQRDPMSQQLWSMHDVVNFVQNSKLPIRGVGYTLYLGSEYETVMLSQAAQMIYQAHQVGLLALLWIYPRGKSVQNDADPELLAGAAGLANALGADFVKIKAPQAKNNKSSAEWLKIICTAAGNTQVICAGGAHKDAHEFLTQLYDQIHTGTTAGAAIGRNIFQYSTEKAINMTHAIASIVYNGKTPKEAGELL